VRPLDVTQRAPVVAVVPSVTGPGLEGLARTVRHEHGDATRPRVREGRLHARPEIVLCRQVHHRVVHEHDVERPAEPERPHVAEDVLAVGVQLAAQRQHLRGEVSEGAGEALLQV
jgi:hypothetical protein